MKLLEKLKNTFFEEEYVEVDEPEEKAPVVAKKVEPREIRKEIKKDTSDVVLEKTETVVEKDQVSYSDSKLANKDSKLPYFEDEDFIEDEVVNQPQEAPKKLYGDTPDKLYGSINYTNTTTSSSKSYNVPTRDSFKPTPIISPIYGILDKNYRKDEVIDRKDKPASYVSRKNADLDSVRRKAYGEINPIEDVSIDNKNEETDDVQLEDNLLYDMTNDNSAPVVDKVTIADAEEYFNDLGLEYNIDYKDSRYEKATGRRTSSNHNDVVDTTSTTDDSSDDANLDDNLFDLIDSMYEDGE